MKITLPDVRTFLLVALMQGGILRGADLPTVSMEHLYYLHQRALDLREVKPDEMVDYCIAQKLGGPVFDQLNGQILWLRIELTKMLKVDMIPPTDPYVRWLQKAIEAYGVLVREEAQRVHRGIQQEGRIAQATLDAIAKSQAAAPSQ